MTSAQVLLFAGIHSSESWFITNGVAGNCKLYVQRLRMEWVLIRRMFALWFIRVYRSQLRDITKKQDVYIHVFHFRNRQVVTGCLQTVFYITGKEITLAWSSCWWCRDERITLRNMCLICMWIVWIKWKRIVRIQSDVDGICLLSTLMSIRNLSDCVNNLPIFNVTYVRIERLLVIVVQTRKKSSVASSSASISCLRQLRVTLCRLCFISSFKNFPYTFWFKTRCSVRIVLKKFFW